MTEKSVTPEERQQVYQLCKSQLGGKWAEVNESDLTIRPVTDGFVNKLYFCFLPQNIKTEYNRVVVRYVDFEEFKDFMNDKQVVTISLILSEKGISPKLLNVFSSGSIIEYIQCRYFDARDDLNESTVKLLAEKVALFHSLEVPITKDGTYETMYGICEKWFDQELRQSCRDGLVRQEIVKHKYEVLTKLDFIDELQWLRNTIEKLNSPLVLSHNDLNRRNILIRESKDQLEVELFLIDFDWTNYNYRGIDLGQYFACWQQKEIDFGYIVFPTDKQMSVFIDSYIKAMSKIFGKQYADRKINSRERLIKEAKIFAMFSFLKDMIHCIWTATKTDNKIILSKAEQRFKCYDELKNRCLEEYDLN